MTGTSIDIRVVNRDQVLGQVTQEGYERVPVMGTRAWYQYGYHGLNKSQVLGQITLRKNASDEFQREGSHSPFGVVSGGCFNTPTALTLSGDISNICTCCHLASRVQADNITDELSLQ